MSDTCKNCKHGGPTYKGIWCHLKDKKVRSTGSCEDHRRKDR